MEYEISDLYTVYPDNDNFIVDKTNINENIKWENNLYDVYPKNDEFVVNTPFVMKDDDHSVQEPYKYTKISNRKYRIFLETEYLEGLYQELSIFMTANKAITIEATSGLNLPNMISIIPIEYPSVPPFVYMNNVLYMNKIYCCHLERVKIIVAKYSNSYREYTNCISCACILKNGNWKKTHMFSDIFIEWCQIRRMKRIVGYELALDDLMVHRELEYYNVMHIMEYLFTPFHLLNP